MMLTLADKDKKYVWHPYTQMSDWRRSNNKVIVRGKGFYLIDSEGRKYLDGIASMWCNVWGHGNTIVSKKLTEQNKFLQHSTLFGLANSPSVMLAERLLKLAKGMGKVFYSDNGSTAIEIGLKIAFQYWRNKGIRNRTKFISLKNGYHGDTIGAMSVGYIRDFFSPYKPMLKKVLKVPSPSLSSCKHYDANEDTEACLQETEDVLLKNSSRCCALIMESGAQIANRARIYPKKYQKKISDLCKKYDVLLILDEIATGFGRLGNMVEYLAQDSFPDIVCFGKALTAGYCPLAVTLVTEELFTAFLGEYSQARQFYHGHTFTGHPLACAAALANLDAYKKYNLMSQIDSNSRYLSTRLKAIRGLSVVKDIRHKGLLAGIDLAIDGKPIKFLKNKHPVSYYIMSESLKMGVFLRPLGNTILIIPPLAINRKDFKFLMDVIYRISDKILTAV